MSGKRLVASILVALTLAAITFPVLNDFGITWDEPEYFVQADRYIKWMKNPTFEKDESPFQVSKYDVHPPLRKFIGGLTHEIFTNQLHLIDNTRGYRISSFIFIFPFLVVFTYVAIGQFGFAIGILCSLIFSFLPHIFFYSVLFTPDYAIGILWFVVVMSGMKAMKSFRWQIMCGLGLGCTALTKLHGLFLIIPIVGYWWLSLSKASRKKNLKFPNVSSFLPLVVICVTAVVVYIVAWPWLWTDTFSHVKEYFAFQLTHDAAPVYIFGTSYERVAWWYVPVILLTTTPAFVLSFFSYGTAYIIRKGSFWEKVILANSFFPLILFMLPFMFRYDGIRLFLPAYPFVILVAGVGIREVVKLIVPSKRVWMLTGITLLWIMTFYYSVIRTHPWESSYYNELVGGIPGAKRLGFETENWGNAFKGVLPWMNAYKKDMMCVYPTTNSFYYYQAMGQIESGVIFNAGLGACKYAVVLMRQGLLDPFARKLVETKKPVYQVLLQGVQLVGVYDIEGMK